MDKARFEQMKGHGATLAIAGRLYKRGLITTAEHRRVVTESRKKHRPAASSRGSGSPASKRKQTEVLGKEEPKEA